MKEQLVEKMISKIEEKLNIKIDRFSYDYDILKILADFDASYKEMVETFLDSFLFENLKSENLDEFLNFFDFYRRNGNNEDLYFIKVNYKSKNKSALNITNNCLIKFNDEFYKVIKEAIITEGLNIIIVEKVFSTEVIKEPLFSHKGTIALDKNFVTSSNEDIVLETEIAQNLTVISFSREPSEMETDFEFLENSKSMLQTYGYSNKKKIELTLLADTRIKSVYIYDSNLITNIVIFPHKLEEIDDIIKYNQHVVDYYKSSNINLIKPNIFEISISGLMTQLSQFKDTDIIKDTIVEDLKNALSLIYVEKDELFIKKEDLLISLKKTIDNFHLEKDIDYRYVNINYNYYYRNNYDVPVLSDVIYQSEKIKNSDVITLGTIE